MGNAQPLDDEKDGARVQEILSAVINLEHVGDIVANNLMEFAVNRIKRGRPFSSDELEIIASMHAEILESLRIGLAVFLAGGYAEASRLVARKGPLRRLETRAMALHVRLLREAALSLRAEEGDRIGVRREQERLQRELTRHQSLVRVTQRHLGLAPPTPAVKPAPGKKRRRRAVARALTAAKQLEKRATSSGEHLVVSGESKGSMPGE